jgi:hypothetical protein
MSHEAAIINMNKVLMVAKGCQEVVDLANVDCTCPRHKKNNNTSPSI